MLVKLLVDLSPHASVYEDVELPVQAHRLVEAESEGVRRNDSAGVVYEQRLRLVRRCAG